MARSQSYVNQTVQAEVLAGKPRVSCFTRQALISNRIFCQILMIQTILQDTLHLWSGSGYCFMRPRELMYFGGLTAKRYDCHMNRRRVH